VCELQEAGRAAGAFLLESFVLYYNYTPCVVATCAVAICGLRTEMKHKCCQWAWNAVAVVAVLTVCNDNVQLCIHSFKPDDLGPSFGLGSCARVAGSLLQFMLLSEHVLLPLLLLLQGELANIIAQLSAGKFKWEEFVMGVCMLAFLISLKYIQRK
jgi:bacteriorhodopsin